MTKWTKMFLVIITLLVMMNVTGCSFTEVSENSEDSVKINYDDEKVTLYSPIDSLVTVETTVEVSGMSIKIDKEIFSGKEQLTEVTFKEWNEKIFSDDAKIVSVVVKKQISEDKRWLVINISMLFIIIIGVVVMLIIEDKKSEKEKVKNHY